jgi:beta-mannanase
MDLPGLYPWSTRDAALFRVAFRHVVSVFRAEGVTSVRWVWSPAGEPGAAAFYPGDDVVDYVGLTVLGDAEWDRELGFARRSFAELLAPRYAEVAALNKPIIVAELGVSGTTVEQIAWLHDATRSLSPFPLVRALVYFDDRNAPNNGRATQPQWRVDPDYLRGLLSPNPA